MTYFEVRLLRTRSAAGFKVGSRIIMEAGSQSIFGLPLLDNE